jgi:ribose/xylose/arabinose/galactoside ABC-type transport system permease subunit
MSDKRVVKKQSLASRIMNPKYIMVYATIGIFLLIYAAGAIAYGAKGFTTLRTFVNLFIDNAHYGISAVGMTMVLITGGIDNSVASIASLRHVHCLRQQHPGHSSPVVHRLCTGGGRGPGPAAGRSHPLPEGSPLHRHPDR